MLSDSLSFYIFLSIFYPILASLIKILPGGTNFCRKNFYESARSDNCKIQKVWDKDFKNSVSLVKEFKKKASNLKKREEKNQ